jgi:hypothetical protein
MRTIATLIVGMSAYACGGSPSAPVQPASSSTNAFTRVISLNGTLDFGPTQVGMTITESVHIVNKGTGAMTVNGLTVPTGFTASWSGMVPAGSFEGVAVTFTASAAQTYGGTLIVNADYTSGTNAIALSGTGVIPSPNVPMLISPVNGAVLPNRTLSSPSAWTFVWSAVPGASAYRLYVKHAPATFPAIDVPGITDTTYTDFSGAGVIDANLQGWQWMVQSDNGWSQMGSFSVAPLAPAPMFLAPHF